MRVGCAAPPQGRRQSELPAFCGFTRNLRAREENAPGKFKCSL